MFDQGIEVPQGFMHWLEKWMAIGAIVILAVAIVFIIVNTLVYYHVV